MWSDVLCEVYTTRGIGRPSRCPRVPSCTATGACLAVLQRSWGARRGPCSCFEACQAAHGMSPGAGKSPRCAFVSNCQPRLPTRCNPFLRVALPGLQSIDSQREAVCCCVSSLTTETAHARNCFAFMCASITWAVGVCGYRCAPRKGMEQPFKFHQDAGNCPAQRPRGAATLPSMGRPRISRPSGRRTRSDVRAKPLRQAGCAGSTVGVARRPSVAPFTV